MSGVSLTSSFNGNLSLGDGRCRIVGCSCFVLFLEQASGCGGCGEAWEARLAKPGQRATTVLSSRYQTIHLFFFPSFLSLEARKIYVIREGVKNNWWNLGEYGWWEQSCKNVPTVPTSWCYFFWPVLIFGKCTRKTGENTQKQAKNRRFFGANFFRGKIGQC